MNFMERLEEGLSEKAADLQQHLRVSTYQKKNGPTGENPSESFLTEASDLAQSEVMGGENHEEVKGEGAQSAQQNYGAQNL